MNYITLNQTDGDFRSAKSSKIALFGKKTYTVYPSSTLNKEYFYINMLLSNQPMKFNYRKYINNYKNCIYNEYICLKFCEMLLCTHLKHKLVYWVPYHKLSVGFCNKQYLNNHFANLTDHKSALTNRFTLAIQHYKL